MNAATLGVCAPNIVARHVQRLRMCIAKGAWGAFRVPGSVTYRYWPLYCSSRVMGNYHARFLGGWARATAPGYPPRRGLPIGFNAVVRRQSRGRDTADAYTSYFYPYEGTTAHGEQRAPELCRQSGAPAGC